MKINLTKSKAIWFGSKRESEDILLPHLGLIWSKKFTLLGIEFDNGLTDLKKNVDEKIVVMENTMNSWLYRNLTPFGKVAVIKSLVLSKLSYTTLVCPLEPSIEKKITKAIFAFIWGNKPDKIKREFAYLPHVSGGLNVPNINDFWKSLRFSWIRRLLISENVWTKILNLNLGQNKTIFDLIYGGPEAITIMAKTLNNHFWKNTLKAFSEIQKAIQFNQMDQILDFNVFGNCLFNRGNTFLNKEEYISLWNKQLFQVRDYIELRGNDLCVLSRNDFNSKYNVNIDFLSYHRLETSLQSALRRAPRVEHDVILREGPNQSIMRNLAFKSTKGCGDFYRVLRYKNNLNTGTNSAERKWAGILGCTYDIRTWNKIWKLHLQSEYTNKFKWMQLQILRNVLPTNKIINIFKPNISAQCSYCGIAEETIKHLFWECNIVQRFWDQVSTIIQRNTGKNIMSQKNIIFGDTTTPGDSLQNIFIMMGKTFIWKRKFFDKNLYFDQFRVFAKSAISDIILALLSLEKFQPESLEWTNILEEMNINLDLLKLQLSE